MSSKPRTQHREPRSRPPPSRAKPLRSPWIVLLLGILVGGFTLRIGFGAFGATSVLGWLPVIVVGATAAAVFLLLRRRKGSRTDET